MRMRFLRKYVLHNLHLKVVSVVLAALVWSAIANERRVEVPFQSPLEFRNMPQSLELSSDLPTSVQVWVRGPQSTVRQLTTADLAVQLDLIQFDRPGERSYTLTLADVRIPFGVHVTQVIPAQVRVRFEARSRRNIPISPRFVGQPAPGYQLAAYQVFPPTITVVGPESHVRVLESASTDPVDITGVIAREQLWTNPFVSDPLVRIENIQPVRVTIQMRKP
jgi:YbbR domain-containing protein